jgi:proteasome lid subunit RPN8/RPN11
MLDKKIKNFIKQHSLKDSPSESCGFIVSDNEDKFKCISCKNISKYPKICFEISPLDFLKVKYFYKKIHYIYHSHTNQNIEFTETDIKCAENLNLPIILYNTIHEVFKIYTPVTVSYDLVGRYFEYKKYDCFTLVRDFYLKKFNSDISGKYEKELGTFDVKKAFLDNLINTNLKIVENKNNIDIYDLLLLDGDKSSHFAVYLGKDKILHQPRCSLSKIENYSSFYKNRTDLIFRLKI